jgi:ubiquinone/menaquinone biosynthesis C-methylase UbiE
LTDQDRVIREKQWHNETHGKDTKSKTKKYYTICLNLFKDEDSLIETCLLPDSTELLDYGCGYGSRLLKYARRIRYGVGIDISERRIEEARTLGREEGQSNIDFYVMDAMNTTFQDQQFDIVIGTAILHHLEMKSALQEIKRIMNHRTGIAIFDEPLGSNPFINLYRKLTPNIRTPDEQPLRKKEIALIMEIFPGTKLRFYSFLTLLAVPFRNRSYFTRMYTFLAKADSHLLNPRSPFRWLAWYCLMELKV